MRTLWLLLIASSAFGQGYYTDEWLDTSDDVWVDLELYPGTQYGSCAPSLSVTSYFGGTAISGTAPANLEQFIANAADGSYQWTMYFNEVAPNPLGGCTNLAWVFDIGIALSTTWYGPPLVQTTYPFGYSCSYGSYACTQGTPTCTQTNSYAFVLGEGDICPTVPAIAKYLVVNGTCEFGWARSGSYATNPRVCD
jgi:hypothetical protein